MADNIEPWKVTQAEFRGFMKAKLEGIEDNVKNHNVKLDNHATKINKVENRLTATEVKGGIFGTLGGIVGGFFGAFLK